MLKGIIVQLNTGLGKHAGTDDALYLGVSGTAGGREFPLDIAWFDDAERRSRVKYALGDVWDADAVVGARRPKEAAGSWNDPALAYIGFEGIDRIYLRKQSARSARSDDAYEIDEIDVRIYADESRRRRFRSNTATWLGTAYGSQIWLPEVDWDSLSVSLRT